MTEIEIDMIPKIIHCVWLSGEEKPEMHKDCLESWQRVMSDYEIKEWSIKNLPDEVLNHPFVKSAIAVRKWAFATDYIRVWALYTYGGVYMDLDVYAYRNFDRFLRHRAFSCIEFDPRLFYNDIKKKVGSRILGCNVEAAVLGAEANHPWIKDVIHRYDGLVFENTPQFCDSMIMPMIISNVSLKYGYKYVPAYQVLDEDIHIYPSDTFSSLYDFSLSGKQDYHDLGDNELRFAYHIVAHSWYEEAGSSLVFKIKHLMIKIFGKSAMNKLKKIVHGEDDIMRSMHKYRK